MLSPDEYRKLLDQLDIVKSKFTGTKRQNLVRDINKKLKEHKYASKYPSFEPSPYTLVFVNRTTTTETLTQLIELIDRSTVFTLDTESTNVRFQPNKPSLIQLQIIPDAGYSTIIFIEVYHLPRPDQSTFKLIQQLFNVLLQPKKIIFIWGELEELEPFTRYGLFSSDQLDLPQQMNVQRRFRTYWSDTYPHQDTLLDNAMPCKCLDCFDITHDNLIGLQDAVAITLNRWIDKRLTRYPFYIGLDPRLRRLNDKELEYRQSMSNYAAYDCDAVKQIIIYTDIINEIQLPIESKPLTVSNNEESTRHSPMNIFVELSTERSPPRNEIPEPKIDYELEQISDDDDNMIISSQSTSNRIVQIAEPTEHQQPNVLLLAIRKQIHNRSCTLRQRRRLYQHKFTIYEVDPRFSIRKIKQMLDDYHIDFTAVNTVKSNSTNKRTLYIGIEDPTLIRRHKRLLQSLFNTRNYNRIYNNAL
jgi:hypothetical protein